MNQEQVMKMFKELRSTRRPEGQRYLVCIPNIFTPPINELLGTIHFLGCYDTEEEAKKVCNEWAVKYPGQAVIYYPTNRYIDIKKAYKAEDMIYLKDDGSVDERAQQFILRMKEMQDAEDERQKKIEAERSKEDDPETIQYYTQLRYQRMCIGKQHAELSKRLEDLYHKIRKWEQNHTQEKYRFDDYLTERLSAVGEENLAREILSYNPEQ